MVVRPLVSVFVVRYSWKVSYLCIKMDFDATLDAVRHRKSIYSALTFGQRCTGNATVRLCLSMLFCLCL